MTGAGNRVLAIVRRNENGEFAQVNSLYTEAEDSLLMIPTPRGLIVVSGMIDEEDERTLEGLIEKILEDSAADRLRGPHEFLAMDESPE